MKKILTLIALAMIFLASCTTKFDLYSYDGDTTIIYSVLEVNADTNYISVTKSSLEHDYYYNPDDIEVSFAGKFEGESTIDTISLPSIEKIVNGEVRTFYYTTNKLIKDQEYEVMVLRKTDSVLVKSNAKTICNIMFKKPLGKYINLRNINVAGIEWIGVGNDDAPIVNAGFYDVYAYFHYKELMPGATDTVDRCMEWKIISDNAKNLYNNTKFVYNAFYTPILFFSLLEKNDYLVNNSPFGVQRWLEPFEIKIFVYGDELYKYYIINNATSAIQEVPNYSNVDNGIGLMSSRTTVSHYYVIEQICRKRITENYPYGFVYDPNL